MKRTALQCLMIVMVMLGVAGCNRHKGAAQEGTQTQTMSPAAAQPAPTGTDAMTQTVDIEDSRSEAEGGGLTEPQTAGTNVTPKSATAGKPAAKARPKPAAKKH